MTDTALRIKDELLLLGAEDRAALAHFLIGTLDVSDEADVEAAWHEAIQRRSGEIDAGTAVGYSAEDVFRRLREKHS